MGRLSSLLTLCVFLSTLSGCSPQEGEDANRGRRALENGSFTAPLNGFVIHYEVHGSGPVVMVVPNSWGIDVAGLRSVFGILEDKLTMVYFDPRGMGQSDPVKIDSDMSVAAVREDFDALREHLGLEQTNAIGWSNGAMNLVLLASERPQTLSSAIFVHGTASFTQEDSARFARQYPKLINSYQTLMEKMKDPDLPDDQKTKLLKRMWLQDFFPASCADPQGGAALVQEAFKDASFSWKHALYTQEAQPDFDARDRLAGITARCLILSGRHDTIPLEKAHEMQEGITGSTLKIFEDSGHFSPLEQPQEFRRAVFEFLGVPADS